MGSSLIHGVIPNLDERIEGKTLSSSQRSSLYNQGKLQSHACLMSLCYFGSKTQPSYSLLAELSARLFRALQKVTQASASIKHVTSAYNRT